MTTEAMLLHYIYLVAIVAEAMSGAIMGMRRGMDLFGLCLVGTVTALGGGSIRDMLLGHYPLGWVAHPQYLAFTITAALVTALLARHVHRLRILFLLVDGLGLVAFSILGCDIALGVGVHLAVAIVFGMITGIFGGVLRDILCNEIPLVLRREMYASVSLVTGAIYVGLHKLGADPGEALLVALGTGCVFRALAIRFKWELPGFSGEGIRGFE
ncbi:trimeric intracellular cation channel family protein [Silvimonas amylolytica]|uniref:Membrane protein n=1 Tax=Silvimonas amylolytica TaxID=449663 RepID=A0ABQ2PPV7_9NEIS|nr:trimeric intracellular cation channel family protein [Silvimonas amylolytica]GGP27658.1 membrane protein [Silvimonas amylolytica]